MATNDFLPFAGAGGANVISNATYAALSARTAGFATGLARSNQLNKVWRQSSLISGAIAQAMMDALNANIVDDGTIANLETQFQQMLMRQVQTNEYSLDVGGSSNILVVTPSPPITSYYNGLVIRVKTANQPAAGGVTMNANGLGSRSVVTPAHAALGAGAYFAGQIITLFFDTAVNSFILLNQDVPFLGNRQFIAASTTFVVPAGVRLIKLRLMAGGGGACGSSTTQAGGGGGGGEYREGVFAVTPAQSFAVTIGGAGAGGGASANGLNGGSTSFGALMAANPGQGGGFAAGSSAGGAGGFGGSGGFLSIPGSSGGDGFFSGVVLPCYGGASHFSGSIRAGSFTIPANGNALSYGGGGSGSYAYISTGTAVGGGAGFQGCAIVEW